ncbi:MAG: YihY/virulence factor BrkB family protein [Deltaproteobacteria bacterium]|nr:YihY/virulence factor BrkB family protein [Deltaproteobacteria bacterium]
MNYLKKTSSAFYSILDFQQAGIWRIRLSDQSPVKRLMIKSLQIILLAIHGFNKDKCSLMASALTFWSLLSIVPVAALAFGIASGFGFAKMLEKLLLEKMPGQEEVILQVVDFSHSLLEKTKGGLIAGIGVLFLFWAVIKVLGNIERSFNDIWKLDKARTLVRKIGDYLSLMIICPFIFIVSSSVTLFITTRITQLTERIDLLGIISPFIFFSFKLAPYILIWILFTFIYMIMPNTKVNFSSGLLGGIAAGTLYQLIQWGYITFQVGVSNYNAIYGSFAALPMFLLWLQISWLVVLAGTELSYAHQSLDKNTSGPDAGEISLTLKRLLTLQIVHLLVKNFALCKKPFTEARISESLGAPEKIVSSLLGELMDCKIVSCVCPDDGEIAAYQPAVDIRKLSINYILNAMDKRGIDDIPLKKSDGFDVLSQSLQTMKEALEQSKANILLMDLEYPE